QGGRPALPLALRGRLEGAVQGPGLRAHRLALRPEPDLAAEVLPRPAGRPADQERRPLVPWARRGHPAAPPAHRRAVGDVHPRRADRVLLGHLVRVALLHHVTWSINSICHTFGAEEFEVRDKSRNVVWLAIASFGESWHNLHHADPTCARHGALKGQLDPSARVIWALEKLGWAYDVRWPDEERLTAKRPATAKRKFGSMTRRAGRVRGAASAESQ